MSMLTGTLIMITTHDLITLESLESLETSSTWNAVDEDYSF